MKACEPKSSERSRWNNTLKGVVKTKTYRDYLIQSDYSQSRKDFWLKTNFFCKRCKELFVPIEKGDIICFKCDFTNK